MITKGTRKEIESVLIPQGFLCMGRSPSRSLFYKHLRTGEIVVFNAERKTVSIIGTPAGGLADLLGILTPSERDLLEFYRTRAGERTTATEAAQALKMRSHQIYKLKSRLKALGYLSEDGKPSRKNPPLAIVEPDRVGERSA